MRYINPRLIDWLIDWLIDKTVKIAAEQSDIKSVELIKKVRFQKAFERVYVFITPDGSTS